jgi:hypothetical protein
MVRNKFYPILLITILIISCTKQERKTESQAKESLDVKDNIGLYLHTMIEWTDNANVLRRRVCFGQDNDIIISAADEKNNGLPGSYQYILFDYENKKVVDTITINDSTSPLLFYKSMDKNKILMENFVGSQRYKYAYREGVSTIDNNEFMSLIKGKYVSESPHSETYYLRGGEIRIPGPLVSRFPEAWPDGINADDKLIRRLDGGVYHSTFEEYRAERYRAIDWKVLNNKFVFMLNSNKESNPYGHRAYYVVRTLDDKLVFTIPEIRAPYLKDKESLNGSNNNPNHETLIDFSLDQKRVLIKGMYNGKLCIMIYDIVTPKEWEKKNNTIASHLILNDNSSLPVETYNQINAGLYSVEPGTTTMYGVIGTILYDNTPLYELPDVNSNIIMQKGWQEIDRFKHTDKDGVSFDEMMCVEILSRSKIKTTINETEDYWYKVIFDSAINFELTFGDDYYKYLEDIYSEYIVWVFGDKIKLLDVINSNIIIHGKRPEALQ